jgi:hypothetical protein
LAGFGSAATRVEHRRGGLVVGGGVILPRSAV